MQGGVKLSTFLWCCFTLCLLYGIGGVVFSWLERDAELESYQRNRFFYKQMKDLYEFDHCSDPLFKDMEFCENQEEFHGMLKSFFERSGNQMKDHEKWTFFGSVFFVSTLVSTLGYGNLHPVTPGGQFFTILFGIIGIPVMGYTLSFIARFVVSFAMSYGAEHGEKGLVNRQILLLCILVPLFILIGGCVYPFLEPWSFLEACYFTSCTLMTVGFGDYLPSHVSSKIVTMMFIAFGLGVMASLIAVLVMHVEARGEKFASHFGTWYDSMSEDCCGAGDRHNGNQRTTA